MHAKWPINGWEGHILEELGCHGERGSDAMDDDAEGRKKLKMY